MRILALCFTLALISICRFVLACDPNQVCGPAALELSKNFTEKLQHIFKEATQVEELRKSFTETNLIKYKDLDGSELLKVTSDKLKKILKLKTEAVDKIADFVRKKSPTSYKAGVRDPPSCEYLLAKDRGILKTTNLTYRKEFNTEVDLTKTVIHVPTDVYEFSKEIKGAIRLTDGLDEVFIKNYNKDRFLFGQYFGSTSGLLRYYPAFFWDTDNKTDYYDCRERPWYIEAAGLPRDIVFLMDTSGSMFGWALRVAKYTAERLLTVISDKDYVAFYKFNLNATAVSCFNNLERARLKYKNHLIKYIKDITAQGASNFSRAVETAFDVLKTSSNLRKSSECQQVIIIFRLTLMLSSSDYVRSDYEDLFRRLNPNRKVRVFTLAFGAPNQWDTSKLRDIACNNNGFFSSVFNYGDVVKAISNIFNVFGQPLSRNIDKIQPSWSSVYYEYDRMNFVVTVGKSVVLDYKEAKKSKVEPFLGVAAIDVDIPQMKTIMTGMFSGIMYAFMVNNNGVIVVHPRLEPIQGFGQGTPDMDLNELELTKKPGDIIKIAERMLNREGISYETTSLVSFNNTIRGKESFQKTKFYYTTLDGYPFSIGIVVPPSERQTIVPNRTLIKNDQVKASVQRNVPHKLRWKKYPLCTLNITETTEFITDEQKLKLATDPCYPDRYDTMMAEVLLTEPMAEYWRSSKFQNFAKDNHILDSYLITNTGIVRSYKNMTQPGTVMDPMDMQPFIHSRKGIPPNRLLISLLQQENGFRSFNISYSLGIPVGDDTFEVLALGVKIQLKVLRKILKVVLSDYSTDEVSATLLDESAFIIYSTAPGYEESSINRLFDKNSPIAEFVLRSGFYAEHEIKDCQQLCNETDNEDEEHQESASPRPISPLSFMTKLLSSLWKVLVSFMSTTTLFTVDPVSATHKSPKKEMCCENYKIYSRDFSRTEQYTGTVPGIDCTKNMTLVPVLQTNILLLIDNNSSCKCVEDRIKRERYTQKLCEGKVSQWLSDLSQQTCFADDTDTGNDTSRTAAPPVDDEREWKCYENEK